MKEESAFLTEQVPISDKLTTHVERQPLLWPQEKETMQMSKKSASRAHGRHFLLSILAFRFHIISSNLCNNLLGPIFVDNLKWNIMRCTPFTSQRCGYFILFV